MRITVTTLIFMAITFGFGLIYIYVGRINDKYVQKNFGWKGFCVFGAIGVPFHEMSHLITALLFFHRIEDVKLFRPVAGKADGCLGYVKHSYRKTIYRTAGNVIIGAAPMIAGAAFIYFVVSKMFPDTFIDVIEEVNNGTSVKDIAINAAVSLKNFFNPSNLASWKFYVCVIAIVFIGCHMNMSWADVKGAWAGATALIAASIVIPYYLFTRLMISPNKVFAVFLDITIRYAYLLSAVLIIDIAMAIFFYLLAVIRGKAK